MTDHEINTAAGMLQAILKVNEHGVAYVDLQNGKAAVLPLWMVSHCKRALEDAKRKERAR